MFGATGYTGRLTVERLLDAGARPVLAGRSPERLARLAAALDADLETVKADVMRRNSVFDMIAPGDVLVSTVGPFAKWGDAAVEAAIAAGGPGTVYLDSTGEPAFIRRVFEDLDGPARAAGVPLLTAMGYDFAPGSLAGALALEKAGAAATRVDIGYYALGSGLDFGSPGTKESLVGASLDPGFEFRDGRIEVVRPAASVRSFAVRGRERPAISIPSAEHFALPASYPGLRDVHVYLGWFGPLARAMQAGTLATSLVTRLPGARTILQKTGERLVALTGSPEPGTTPGGLSWIAATAYGSGGDRLAEVHLAGTDGYDFTARFLAWSARHAAEHGIDGAGALGPVAAFGVETLERGCAEAGLKRVHDPAAA